MRKYFVTAAAFLVILLGIHSAYGIILEGEVLWEGESLPFSLVQEEEKIGITMQYEGERAFRVFADIDSHEVVLIDDLNRSYTEGQDEVLMATGFLLVLSQILSVQDDWWWQEDVAFYGEPEPVHLPPFGESVRLKVGDTPTGVVWNRGVQPSLGEILGGILGPRAQDELGTAFWKDLFSLPGLPVAHIIEGETVYRLFEIVDEEIQWQELSDREGYLYQEWPEFLAPLKG